MKAEEELAEIRREVDEQLAAGKDPTPQQLRREYAAYAERNRRLIIDFSTRARWLLAGIVVVLLVLGGASLKLTTDIQNSRREQCSLANERHRQTMTQLRIATEELPPNRRHEAEAQKRSTERLINAISPLRDCSKI